MQTVGTGKSNQVGKKIVSRKKVRSQSEEVGREIDDSKLSLAYLTNSLDPVRLVQNLRILDASFIHFLPQNGPDLKRKERASFNKLLL